ncbi:MAG: hypothetical protein JXA10_16150 [Anaerolineae bacterium]|nr:hypothetical protein [Anaerolineae bacterium]
MIRRGLYNREGELLGYLADSRVYDHQDQWIGELRGTTIYDRDGDRRWLVDHDALLDLRGNVIGYLGEAAPYDR